jgi:hypothetical protein
MFFRVGGITCRVLAGGGCRLMGDEDGPAISSASIIKNRDILSTTSECHRTLSQQCNSCTNIYLIECNE